MKNDNPYLASPYEVVQRAIEKNELDKLLLGKPEYCYLTRFSSEPENTEISSLLSIFYQYVEKYSKEQLCKNLTDAIYKIYKQYDGIKPTVSCIRFEISNIHDGKTVLGLPLKEITLTLRRTIKQYQDRLTTDKTGGGYGREDGRYGELQRLSRIVVGYGGLAFCEGTEHDPIKPFL